MLQKIRVIATLVVFCGGLGEGLLCCCFFKLYFFKKFECVVNFVSMSSSFCFLWRLIFSCHRLSGLVHFFTLCMTSLFKKKKKKSLSSGVCFVCSNMQTSYFLNFFFFLALYI